MQTVSFTVFNTAFERLACRSLALSLAKNRATPAAYDALAGVPAKGRLRSKARLNTLFTDVRTHLCGAPLSGHIPADSMDLFTQGWCLLPGDKLGAYNYDLLQPATNIAVALMGPWGNRLDGINTVLDTVAGYYENNIHCFLTTAPVVHYSFGDRFTAGGYLGSSAAVAVGKSMLKVHKETIYRDGAEVRVLADNQRPRVSTIDAVTEREATPPLCIGTDLVCNFGCLAYAVTTPYTGKWSQESSYVMDSLSDFTALCLGYARVFHQGTVYGHHPNYGPSDVDFDEMLDAGSMSDWNQATGSDRVLHRNAEADEGGDHHMYYSIYYRTEPGLVSFDGRGCLIGSDPIDLGETYYSWAVGLLTGDPDEVAVRKTLTRCLQFNNQGSYPYNEEDTNDINYRRALRSTTGQWANNAAPLVPDAGSPSVSAWRMTIWYDIYEGHGPLPFIDDGTVPLAELSACGKEALQLVVGYVQGTDLRLCPDVPPEGTSASVFAFQSPTLQRIPTMCFDYAMANAQNRDLRTRALGRLLDEFSTWNGSIAGIPQQVKDPLTGVLTSNGAYRKAQFQGMAVYYGHPASVLFGYTPNQVHYLCTVDYWPPAEDILRCWRTVFVS